MHRSQLLDDDLDRMVRQHLRDELAAPAPPLSLRRLRQAVLPRPARRSTFSVLGARPGQLSMVFYLHLFQSARGTLPA